MKTNVIATSLLLAFGALTASAQPAANTIQRDVNQQTRIEQGLQSGSLSTKEASHLEKEQSAIDRMQAKALKDGNLSPAERAELTAAQNKASHDINAAKTNDIKGNPQSASSQRMQADVQRNINQEQRIEQGVKSGTLTNREAANLERGQARVSHKEAVASRDGHVGAHEQNAIQRKEDHQSRRIYGEKHNTHNRKG